MKLHSILTHDKPVNTAKIVSLGDNKGQMILTTSDDNTAKGYMIDEHYDSG